MFNHQVHTNKQTNAKICTIVNCKVIKLLACFYSKKCKFPNYINYIFLCLKLIIKHYHSQKI